MTARHVNDAVGQMLQLLIGVGADRNHPAATGTHLFDVRQHRCVSLAAAGDHDDRRPVADQRDRTVLHFASWVGLAWDISDLSELQRTFESSCETGAAPEKEEVGRLAVPLSELVD